MECNELLHQSVALKWEGGTHGGGHQKVPSYALGSQKEPQTIIALGSAARLRMRLCAPPWEAQLCRHSTCLGKCGNAGLVPPGNGLGCAEIRGKLFWGEARDSRSAKGE